MTFFNNIHSQAQLWRNTLSSREDKKQVLQPMVEVQETQVYYNVANHPQVIFSQADLGHNEEEKRQIQDLYGELNNLSVSPVFAGT